MYQNYRRSKCDPKDPYKPEYYGVFEQKIEVDGKQRRMLTYVPDGTRASTAGILILGENGQTADDLLEHSGWKEMADQEERKEKLIVCFLEPENGMWNTQEPYGVPDGDVAYIDAAAIIARDRHFYCIHESKLYIVGCREGGVLANMSAAYHPSYYAGIATVGGSQVEKDYLDAARDAFCIDLDGYEDPAHRYDITKGQIPMPAWVIDDPDAETGTGQGILDYWCSACETEKTPRQINPDQWEYYRTTEPAYWPNQEKEAYRVCYSSIPGSSADSAKGLQRRVWKDFLEHQRRWMSCPGGDLRVTRDPVRDIGMEYHYEEFDGWMREWYVYIPEAVKKNPDKKVPMIFAMHGYTCSGEIYIGNSDWQKVAEKYGFIVVFPSALHGKVSMEDCGLMSDWTLLGAWNVFQEDDRPDELRFFHYMLDRMIAEYPVDPDCVFASGHSWGSLMTEMLALGMTDRLAAVAPCSGAFFGGAYKRMTEIPQLYPYNGKQLPVWMFWGMEEEWLIPGTPTHDNETGLTIEMWLKKNNKSEMIPEDWSTVPCTANGRFLDYSFEKEGTAPVKFTQVDYMPHATMTEMSFRIWEEFFSKFAHN